MEPWYRSVTPRDEVRRGRSFNPDEFAIHLEQVVAGTAPADYRDADKFFSRNFFTKALLAHAGMVLRRLSGRTENAAPVLTLITQFGGGKTHTLAALYHLAGAGPAGGRFPGVGELLAQAGVPEVPAARVGVFVGNAWDPQPGRETPWIDLARQLAGDRGVEILGPAAATTPPGTEALGRLFAAAGGTVLVLCDEVLNFLNRHRGMADPFHAFLQNLTVAMTGTTRGAAMISLPRSQVEMTAWDHEWQERISKVVRRVAKDLIANDEAEISEVVRRRLFEDLGKDRVRAGVARGYADWCFERRGQLPPEWTMVDSAAGEKEARALLRRRFESCYPFHPATLSVFQRKWQALHQYQQTRGTLAMLAQWVSRALQEGCVKARREPLITLGSAPLEDPGFRSVVLGQLGEARLEAAILADIAGDHSHARALDQDSDGILKDIHRRVATVILFESSGGQAERVAHLPELRFALLEPEVDTTSIDTAAFKLEAKAFFIRRAGSDGFQIHHQATLRKAVADRRASLDPDAEVRPAMLRAVQEEFRKGATLPVVAFPEDGAAIPDTPRLTLVVLEPENAWGDDASLRARVGDWTRMRGKSPRLHPGALVWCVKKPGRDLRDRVETALAWQRVAKEVSDGTLGPEFSRADRKDVEDQVKTAAGDIREEVWADYRFLVLHDPKEAGDLHVIDLGAGHASTGQTLCGRVIGALKSEGYLSEGVGAGLIERNWPPSLKDAGAWPLAGLRKCFLDGSLTRLLDPDTTLRTKLPEFVLAGDLGLASGPRPDGTYDRVWFTEPLPPDEVAFETGVFLLTKDRARLLKQGRTPGVVDRPPETAAPPPPEATRTPPPAQPPAATASRFRIAGPVPSELWNKLGTKLIPRLRSGNNLSARVEFAVEVPSDRARHFLSDLRQALADLGLADAVRIEET